MTKSALYARCSIKDRELNVIFNNCFPHNFRLFCLNGHLQHHKSLARAQTQSQDQMGRQAATYHYEFETRKFTLCEWPLVTPAFIYSAGRIAGHETDRIQKVLSL